jgi:hypothetical protein
MQPLALAQKQVDAEIFLELADARRDVGLHAVQLFRRARDAAFAHHGGEDAEIGKVHWIISDRDQIYHNYSFYVMFGAP